MAKAQIITKEGIKIIVEGSPKEIAKVIRQIREEIYFQDKSRESKVRSRKVSSKLQKVSPLSLIKSLINEGFFQKSQNLSAIKTALEERGHFYPKTSLSPALLRLIRKRLLRRIKKEKKWFYTK